MVGSNHTHLLVKDTAANVIAHSIQLIARRTARKYYERKAQRLLERVIRYPVLHVAAV
jgi:hypothetical protein